MQRAVQGEKERSAQRESGTSARERIIEVLFRRAGTGESLDPCDESGERIVQTLASCGQSERAERRSRKSQRADKEGRSSEEERVGIVFGGSSRLGRQV